jgi:hypothetical protein
MKGSLLLYNTAGQLMLEKELQQSNTLDLSALKTGAYVVKIQTASGSVVKKIVKY